MFLLKVPNFWRCTLNYLQMTWYVTCDCKIKTEVDGGWIRRAGEALGLGCAVKTVVMSLEFCHKGRSGLPSQTESKHSGSHFSCTSPRWRTRSYLWLPVVTEVWRLAIPVDPHLWGGVCRSRSERAPLSPFPAEAISCLAVWNL